MGKTYYRNNKPYKHVSSSGKVTRIKNGKDPNSKSSSSKSKSKGSSKSSSRIVKVEYRNGKPAYATDASGKRFASTKTISDHNNTKQNTSKSSSSSSRSSSSSSPKLSGTTTFNPLTGQSSTSFISTPVPTTKLSGTTTVNPLTGQSSTSFTSSRKSRSSSGSSSRVKALPTSNSNSGLSSIFGSSSMVSEAPETTIQRSKLNILASDKSKKKDFLVSAMSDAPEAFKSFSLGKSEIKRKETKIQPRTIYDQEQKETREVYKGPSYLMDTTIKTPETIMNTPFLQTEMKEFTTSGSIITGGGKDVEFAIVRKDAKELEKKREAAKNKYGVFDNGKIDLLAQGDFKSSAKDQEKLNKDIFVFSNLTKPEDQTQDKIDIFESRQAEIDKSFKSNPYVSGDSGQYTFQTPVSTLYSTTEATRGSDTFVSKDTMHRQAIPKSDFMKGVKEVALQTKVSPKTADTNVLARMSGAAVGSVILGGGYLSGQKQSIDVGASALQKAGVGADSSKVISKIGSYTAMGLTGGVGLRATGAGIKGVGQQMAWQTKGKAGTGFGYVGKRVEVAGSALPKVTAVSGTAQLGVTEGYRKVTTTEEDKRNKQNLKNKYGFSASAGQAAYNRGIASTDSTGKGFIAGISPMGGAALFSEVKELGDDSINRYLDSKGITNPRDRQVAKDLIYAEFKTRQYGEIAGLGAGAATTERIGSQYFKTKFGAGQVFKEGSKREGITALTGQASRTTASLGISEGMASELTTAGSRGEDVSGKQLLTSGTIGGISAGVLGGMVTKHRLTKGLGVKESGKQLTRKTAEVTGYVLDPYEGVGDILEKIGRKKPFRGPTVGVSKLKSGFKTTTIGQSSTTTNGQKSLIGNMKSKLQALTSSRKSLTSTRSQLPIGARTNVPSITGVPTFATTPTIVSTPTITETISPVVGVQTLTDMQAKSSTAAQTSIPVFTPLSGAMVMPPGFKGTGMGWGNSSRSQRGFKVNPIQSLNKKVNRKKFNVLSKL